MSTELPESGSLPQKSEASKKVESSQKVDLHPKVDVPQKLNLPQKVEASQKVDLPQKAEASQKVDLPQKVEASQTRTSSKVPPLSFERVNSTSQLGTPTVFEEIGSILSKFFVGVREGSPQIQITKPSATPTVDKEHGYYSNSFKTLTPRGAPSASPDEKYPPNSEVTTSQLDWLNRLVHMIWSRADQALSEYAIKEATEAIQNSSILLKGVKFTKFRLGKTTPEFGPLKIVEKKTIEVGKFFVKLQSRNTFFLESLTKLLSQ
jgi:hypothetical protein